MTLRRYTLDPQKGLVEDAQGEFVRYTDVAALDQIRSRAAERQRRYRDARSVTLRNVTVTSPLRYYARKSLETKESAPHENDLFEIDIKTPILSLKEQEKSRKEQEKSKKEEEARLREEKKQILIRCIAQVFAHWQQVWDHPHSALDAKRTKIIKQALAGYSVDTLCQAISGYKNSPHHTGNNDRSTVYDGLHLLLRDSDHIDAGLRFARAPPVLTSKLDRHNIAVLKDWRPPEMRNDDNGFAEIPGHDGEPGDDLWTGDQQAVN